MSKNKYIIIEIEEQLKKKIKNPMIKPKIMQISRIK